MSVVERDKKNELHCAYKHLSAARINFLEVLEKLERLNIENNIEFDKNKIYKLLYVLEKSIVVFIKIYLSEDIKNEDLSKLCNSLRAVRGIFEKEILDIIINNIDKIGDDIMENAIMLDLTDFIGNIANFENHILRCLNYESNISNGTKV